MAIMTQECELWKGKSEKHQELLSSIQERNASLQKLVTDSQSRNDSEEKRRFMEDARLMQMELDSLKKEAKDKAELYRGVDNEANSLRRQISEADKRIALLQNARAGTSDQAVEDLQREVKKLKEDNQKLRELLMRFKSLAADHEALKSKLAILEKEDGEHKRRTLKRSAKWSC